MSVDIAVHKWVQAVIRGCWNDLLTSINQYFIQDLRWGREAESGNFSFFFPLINWLATYTFAGLINGSHAWDQPHVQDKLKSLPGEQQEAFPWYDFNYVQYHHLSVVCNVRTSTYTILHANTVSCTQRFFTWLVYTCEGLPVAYPKQTWRVPTTTVQS